MPLARLTEAIHYFPHFNTTIWKTVINNNQFLQVNKFTVKIYNSIKQKKQNAPIDRIISKLNS